MKLLKLKIRNFGKLNDREIELSDGINLIYGENGSGKSTIHTFIKSMLFGLERGRGRASVNDTFSRYEPWENPSFYSGSLQFEVGGKTFRLDRNFDKNHKKATLFCENDGEELSVEDGDLEMLLGDLSESVYENTVSIGQLKAEPGQSLATALSNYATNFYASGDGELDFEGALDKLKDRKRDIEKNIKEEFRKNQEKREKLEQEASFIWREVHKLQGNYENLKEQIAYRKEHQKEEDDSENVSALEELRSGKWRIHPLEIAVFVAVVAGAGILINRPWNYLVAIVLTLCGVVYTWNRMKVGKKQEKTEPEKLLEEITPEEEKIPLERLIWEAGREAEELREKETQYNNLREQLEEMHEMGEEFWELEKQREAVDLAIRKLNDLAADFQKRLRERMNKLASEVLSELTDGVYTQIVVEEQLKMSLLSEGRKIPIEQLSQGTVEQMYFALRVSAAQILNEENNPLILDDTFVCYDDKRLESTLHWLGKSKQQILLFTCQKREEEILKREGITYHKYEISKK